MKLTKLIKQEFSNFNKLEKIFFPIVIIIVIFISFLIKDSKIALISAICGISYTILAGKGRVSCYFIGITGTICYSYISFINGLIGQLLLYSLYYLPMEIIGIYKWSKHLKKEEREIVKTKLTKKEIFIYFVGSLILSLICGLLFKITDDKQPYIDSFTVVFSVLGQFLTVKRCIEQWYVWSFVNIFSLIMWIIAYINGSNCFATILMWSVYFVLGIYFLIQWKKEVK